MSAVPAVQNARKESPNRLNKMNEAQKLPVKHLGALSRGNKALYAQLSKETKMT